MNIFCVINGDLNSTMLMRKCEYLLCIRNMNIYSTLGGDLKYPLSTLNYSKSCGPNREHKRLLCIR